MEIVSFSTTAISQIESAFISAISTSTISLGVSDSGFVSFYSFLFGFFLAYLFYRAVVK